MNDVAKTCGLRISYRINFVKFTMMKSVITSNTEKETKIIFECYEKFISDNGHAFKEKKKPKAAAGKSKGYQRVTHKIESAK